MNKISLLQSTSILNNEPHVVRIRRPSFRDLSAKKQLKNRKRSQIIEKNIRTKTYKNISVTNVCQNNNILFTDSYLNRKRYFGRERDISQECQNQNYTDFSLLYEPNLSWTTGYFNEVLKAWSPYTNTKECLGFHTGLEEPPGYESQENRHFFFEDQFGEDLAQSEALESLSNIVFNSSDALCVSDLKQENMCNTFYGEDRTTSLGSRNEVTLSNFASTFFPYKIAPLALEESNADLHDIKNIEQRPFYNDNIRISNGNEIHDSIFGLNDAHMNTVIYDNISEQNIMPKLYGSPSYNYISSTDDIYSGVDTYPLDLTCVGSLSTLENLCTNENFRNNFINKKNDLESTTVESKTDFTLSSDKNSIFKCIDSLSGIPHRDRFSAGNKHLLSESPKEGDIAPRVCDSSCCPEEAYNEKKITRQLYDVIVDSKSIVPFKPTNVRWQMLPENKFNSTTVKIGFDSLGPRVLARTKKLKVWQNLGGKKMYRKKCDHINNSYTVQQKQINGTALQCCYTCVLCNKNFALKSSVLRHHRMVHDFERRYECAQCSALYYQLSDVKRHLLASHTSLKPFKCFQCNAVFSRSGQLSKHIKSCYKM